MENVEILKLKHYALLSYLRSRCIDEGYCNEIHYELRKRPYFAIAFENITGGYEVRNPYYKGCIKGKNISIIRINKDIRREHVCVFEGFMDFLSYLTLQNKGDYHICLNIPVDYLVMNSVSNLKKCLVALEQYSHIHCYLDNDLAGQKTMETIAGLSTAV